MTGVRSNFGITSYGDQVKPISGTGALIVKARGYANPSLNQISTWTWTLSDTVGEVTATITLPDGTQLTATGVDAGSTDTTHADTIALAINTDDAWSNVATASNVAGAITVTYIHTGITYPFVTFSSPGAGVLTPTAPETQAAGGGRFPEARWVIAAANATDPDIPALALPDGAAATALIGVTARPHGVNTLPDDLDVDADPFRNGSMVPVIYDGAVYVTNVGAASLANGTVHVVTSTAGGDALGESRGDAQNSVALSNNDAYWIDPTPSGQRGRIFIRR